MENVAAVFLEYARLDRRRTAEGLSIVQMARWQQLKRLLDSLFGRQPIKRRCETTQSTSQPAERDSVRTPSRLECSFDSMGSFRQQRITNLSRGGVFIRTDEPLPIGTKVKLCIHIERPDTDLEVESIVVSNNVGPRFDLEARGMGMRFSSIAPEVINRICDLYEREIERAFCADGRKQP